MACSRVTFIFTFTFTFDTSCGKDDVDHEAADRNLDFSEPQDGRNILVPHLL
jgi:hypothetical protein